MSAHNPAPCDDAASAVCSIESLLAPWTLGDFEAQHWERSKPLLLRGGSARRFDALFRADEIDALLAAALHDGRHWDLFSVRDAVPNDDFTEADGRVQLAQVLSHYRQGRTLRLRHAEHHHAGLAGFARRLGDTFHAPASVIAWLSHDNPDAEPVDYLHFDPPQQFIAQIHGRRHWKLYDFDARFYAPRSGDPEVDRRDYGPPCMEFDLEAGDLLYLPAGVPHDVSAASAHSLHLSLTLDPVRWREVLESALAVIDQSGSALSRPVPRELLARSGHGACDMHGGLWSVVQEALGAMHSQRLEQELRLRRIRAGSMAPDGGIWAQLHDDAPLEAETRVQRRDGVVATVSESPRRGTARILFTGGGAIDGPGELAPLLRAIAGADASFSALDLPDDYDASSRVLLLTRLVHAGLLTRAQKS